MIITASVTGLDKMTEHTAPDDAHKEPMQELASSTGTMSIQPKNEIEDPMAPSSSDKDGQVQQGKMQKSKSVVGFVYWL